MPFISACQRCHAKKIKCDGIKPSCQPCTDARTNCIPHIRQQRGFDKRGAAPLRQRVAWLENGLSDRLGLEVSNLKTGSDLGRLFDPSKRMNSLEGDQVTAIESSSAGNSSELPEQPLLPSPDQDSGSDEVAIRIAPDVSLLTLNASGEMRYLGPSSGSFFAQYAISFARAIVSAKVESSTEEHQQQYGRQHIRPSKAEAPKVPNTSQLESSLTSHTCQYLQSLFFKWVHVVWPLLDDDFEISVLTPLHDSHHRQMFASGSHLQLICLSTYYLVLALGAVHVDSHSSVDDLQGFEEYQRLNADGALSADCFFIKAIESLDQISHSLFPSISLIRVLVLICIYGSFKPSGNRQWQLAGIAIRTAVEIGLHRHRSNWNFSKEELNIRQRVFWVAYAIEITVSFNLGRPPSISAEHIDAQFPAETPEIILGLHHVRHRQIQSKILSEVYCGQQKAAGIDPGQKVEIISRNQESLDGWKSKLHEIYSLSKTPYPLQYWERLYHATTAAIHRPTPLVPIPSITSTNRCIRAAGNYIDAHHRLLTSKKVPQSWMLLQGMVLAGVTMVVTARTNKSLFPDRMECSVIEIMEWHRKCSVVLNIMSERWSDHTISDLESNLSLLANDTLKQLMLPDSPSSVSFNAPQRNYSGLHGNPADSGFPAAGGYLPETVFGASLPQQGSSWSTDYNFDTRNMNQLTFQQSVLTEVNSTSSNGFPFDGGSMDFFPLETFIGINDTSLWNILPTQDDMNINWLGTL